MATPTDGGINTSAPLPFKIRCITQFLSSNFSEEEWDEQMHSSAEFLRTCKETYERTPGLEVQTLRVATRALQTAAPEAACASAVALEAAALRHGITFLSLGATGPENSSAFLKHSGLISQLAATLTATSFSVAWQRSWGFPEAKALAREIFAMAALTDGAANFRFGVAFNCPPGIPFFPAACAGEGTPPSFALGTENSGILFNAFSEAAAKTPNTVASHARGFQAREREPPQNGNSSASDVLQAAHDALRAALIAALQPLEASALEIQSQTGVSFLGIDSSIAPALAPPTLPAAFESLGLGPFGGHGTLAIAERITAALKSLPVKLCGYCGLMLPVCEDVGLAAAAASGAISLQTLLLYSAVCGVGLDTVPVSGIKKTGASEKEVESLENRVAAVLLDVAALSNRLGGKPLSVRLLPVAGAVPGEVTAFSSPYLVDSVAMAL